MSLHSLYKEGEIGRRVLSHMSALHIHPSIIKALEEYATHRILKFNNKIKEYDTGTNFKDSAIV
jgi:hypothetical protein